jgi:hypothetical protein
MQRNAVAEEEDLPGSRVGCAGRNIAGMDERTRSDGSHNDHPPDT